MKGINKITYLNFLLAGILFVACQSSEEPSAINKDVAITYEESSDTDREKYVATLAIEGMACQMSCGSKIASTLNGLKGVKETEIEFNGTDAENFAIVEFNNSEVSEKELIDAVQALANGHYKVNSVKVTHFKIAALEENEGDDLSLETPKIEYKLPNIFSVFSRIF